MTTKSFITATLLFAVFFLSACGESNKTSPSPAVQVKSASTEPATAQAKPAVTEPSKQPQDGPAVATITAPDYQAKIHQVISFTPKNDGMDMIKAKSGYRYVVLDLSVKNTSQKKEVDMGQILLSSRVTDEKGKEYTLHAMAIAAYTLQNPNPYHQAQYNAMWGKIKPGEFFRTTALGLEIPTSTKNLVLSLKEDGDTFKDSRRFQAKFAVE